jgi:peptidyl-dipeptidase Dcp
MLTAFERETLNKLNMPEEIVMRHRIHQFGHIFQAMDMLQNYYSYLWADVINTDSSTEYRRRRIYMIKKSRRGLYSVLVGNTTDQRRRTEVLGT